MGYVAGFDTDVFISYAHKNNADGWVTGLDDFLSKRVPQFLEHAADIVVWRDRSLTGFGDFNETLKSQINTSALFVSICSPVYVTSEYCENEAKWFVDQSVEVPRIERRSRIARIVIIPYDDIPDILPAFRSDQTIQYRFYDPQSDGTFLQYEIDSAAFKAKAEQLAQHIANLLRRMRAEANRAATRGAPHERKKIFVANCSKDRRDDRTTVLNEFKSHELLTIPDDEYSSSEIVKRTLELLKHSDCSIHILGENPGIRPNDSDEPIVRLQYRLALAHRPPTFTQIVWASRRLNLPDGPQKEFIEAVRAFKPDVWAQSTEVMTGGLDELLRGIGGILTRANAPIRIEGGGPLYLLCSKSDLDSDDENFAKLRDFLRSVGVLPELPAFEDTDDQDIDLAELEKNSIAQSCATLIYYGRGGPAWVKQKRQTLIRVLSELNAQRSHPRALYLSPPSNQFKKTQYLELKTQEFPEAKGYPPLLVLGTASNFEGDYLKPLLDRLGGPR